MSFTAKYDGRCIECKEPIYAGDVLEWVEKQVIHVECIPDDAKALPQRPTCSECWQEIAVNGECACT